MNKFFRTLYIVPLSFLMTGCWTSIYTVSDPVVVHEKKPAPSYVTTVTTPSPKVKTVTSFTVTRYNTDPCFSLDLNAVAAAFAESNSVRDFEQILNSSRYMINNLDLNRDGWVDYVRVIENSKGYYHTLLLQACLAPGVFQDVATIVAERRSDVLYVEVIGDRYLYGYNYIVRPVFVKRPPLWSVYGRSTYAVWSSPYYYGSFPSYYTQPKPVYVNHYSGYTEMTRSYSRNDYGAQHPSDSFDQRVTRAAASSGVTVRNAEQLRMEVEKTSPRTSGAITGTSGSSVSNAPGASKSSGTTGVSGSSTTTRSSGATSATRTSNTSNVTRSSGTSGSSNTSRSSGAVNSISTRVNKSGTTRTTVTTTDATGRTTTVKRESVNASRASGSTQTSGTSSRTSGAISAPDKQPASSLRSGQRVR